MNASHRRARTLQALLAASTTGALLLGGGLFYPASAQSASPGSAPVPGQPASVVVAKVLPEPTPAELAEGQALLARAAKATFLGEPSDLRNFSWTDSGAMHIGPQLFPARTKTVLVPSHCYWSEQLLPMGVATVAFCDSSGWARTPTQTGVRDLSAEEWKQQRRDREMDIVHVLLEASKLKARPIPDTVLSAGPAAGVSIASNLVNDWRIWMDKKTGRIVRSDFLAAGPTGEGIARHVWEYHDYQPASKLLRWPSLRTKSVNGVLLLDLSLQHAASNIEAPESLFERP